MVSGTLATRMFALAALVALAACSDGGTAALGGTSLPSLSGSNGMQSVTVRMLFGGANGTAQSAQRKPQFVSPSTEGVLAQVSVHGSSTVVASSATDVSPGSAACGGSSSPTRTCTVSVAAPVGNDDFAFTTYDAAPSVAGAGGSFPATAHELGSGAVEAQTIVVNTANTLAIYISGVIASIGSSHSYASLPADGAAHSFAFVVDPQDFDNNAITAGTNDPYENPITVTLAESGGSGHAHLVLNGANAGTSATLRYSSDTLSLAYDGGGAAGYGTAVTLTAPGAPTQTVDVSPLYVTSASAYFTANTLTFTGGAQAATLALSELNAPATVTYAATPTGCSNLASAGSVSGSGASANVAITAGTTAGTGCTFAVADSLGTSVTVVASLTTSGSSITVPSSITEYAIPTASSYPTGIAVGPDGNLWFTEQFGNNIGKITPGGTITEYAIPTTSAGPLGIAAGPDGNVWFTEGNANKIGKITPSGTITEYPVPTAGSRPYGIAAGADGNVWFTESSANQIGKITPSGTITEYATPTANSYPTGIAEGPDGNVWFTENISGKIGKITPGGTITEYAIPTAISQPFGIAAGPDGNVWFTENGSGNIGKITPSGVITEYLTTASSGPSGIAAGPDGNLWFTEGNVNQIGKITPSGAITEYAIPTANSQPFGIAAGPDGNLWFTENGSGTIGKISP